MTTLNHSRRRRRRRRRWPVCISGLKGDKALQWIGMCEYDCAVLPRSTPTASTSVPWWWSTRPRPAASTTEWPPTGSRTSWWTTATSPPCPCTSASPSSGCPSSPPTRSSWWARALASLPSWASSRREAGSKSRVSVLLPRDHKIAYLAHLCSHSPYYEVV